MADQVSPLRHHRHQHHLDHGGPTSISQIDRRLGRRRRDDHAGVAIDDRLPAWPRRTATTTPVASVNIDHTNATYELSLGRLHRLELFKRSRRLTILEIVGAQVVHP